MILEREIIRSSNEAPVTDIVVAYYDDNFNLVINHERYLADGQYIGSESASVSKNRAYELCRHLRLGMTELTAFLADEFFCAADSLTPEDVNACFSDMISFLLAHNIRYRMHVDNCPF